jgi:hypothetical protein
MRRKIELTYTRSQSEIFFNIPEGCRFQIVTKGRRFGATQGAAQAFIEWAAEGKKMLWGDTINSNIDRYIERYFLPAMKGSGLNYQYHKQQKQLNIEQGYIDFRSADRPENWEGFGYDIIFLNEAGIILKNKYLYTNAVLPMLMDSPDSLLIAAGVPKGYWDKEGDEHPFYTLYKSAKNGQKGYNVLEFTSYDNPFLTKQDVQALQDEIGRMSNAMMDQEIYGKFVEGAASVLWTPELINHTNKIPALQRISIGVDPSGSVDGDEVGIVAVGKDHQGYLWVLSDNSGAYTPLQWATVTVNEYNSLQADSVVAERNFGGDMVASNILAVSKMVNINEVTASRSKQVRAEPVVSMYEQGLVKHARGLNQLENEMLTWVPGSDRSPNRVDALVWAVYDLMSAPEIDDVITDDERVNISTV